MLDLEVQVLDLEVQVLDLEVRVLELRQPSSFTKRESVSIDGWMASRLVPDTVM